MAVLLPDRSLGYRAEVGVWGGQGFVAEVGRVMVVEDCDEGAGPPERCSELPGGQCEKGKQVGLISLMQGLSAWAAVMCWADRSLL